MIVVLYYSISTQRTVDDIAAEYEGRPKSLWTHANNDSINCVK